MFSYNLLEYLQADSIKSLFLNEEYPYRKITITKSNDNSLVLVDNKNREFLIDYMKYDYMKDFNIDTVVEFIKDICIAFEIETEIKLKGE